jgi:hypothetical protein
VELPPSRNVNSWKVLALGRYCKSTFPVGKTIVSEIACSIKLNTTAPATADVLQCIGDETPVTLLQNHFDAQSTSVQGIGMNPAQNAFSYRGDPLSPIA